jgi:hypothetical protein
MTSHTLVTQGRQVLNARRVWHPARLKLTRFVSVVCTVAVSMAEKAFARCLFFFFFLFAFIFSSCYIMLCRKKGEKNVALEKARLLIIVVDVLPGKVRGA